MKVKVNCDNPPALLRAIIRQIASEDIKTWEIKRYEDLYLFSHSPKQWSEKAMMQASIQQSTLTFEIAWWESDNEPENAIKGYILGRFIELLMVHFREYFNDINIE